MDNATQATPPVAAPVSENPIGDLARGFLDDLDRNTDPHQMGHAPTPEEAEKQAQAEAETPETEGEQEAENATPEAPEVPMAEFELDDGTKVLIPEVIKPHVMRDKDYRQKTMAIAEQRKAADTIIAQAQQVAAQAQQMAPYYAQLHAMDTRANQIHAALQSPELAQDPLEFNKLQGELAILLRNRDHFASGLSQHQQTVNEQQAAIRYQRMALDAPKLFEEFPDLQKIETRNSLGQYVREQGLSDEEFNYLNFSVPGSRLAYKAMQYDKLVKQQAETKAKLKATVTNMPAAAQSSRASSSNQEAQTKQLQKQWAKGGGKLHDPAFSQILRNTLRGKT